MHSENLEELVFFNPVKLGANKLCILSGYATPNMASWLIKNINERLRNKSVELNLIIGMVPFDGLSISVHEGFKELQTQNMPKEIRRFLCSYVYTNAPVHSKLYLWLKNDNPIIAFTGSANFTQKAFSHQRREVLVECDPTEAYKYYCSIENDTIYCNHGEVEEYIILHPSHAILDMENKPTERLSGSEIDQVTLSLLTKKTGETGQTSGLNWGHRRKIKRNRNEAYIPLPSAIAKSGFFPINKQHFTVVTDDQHQLILRVEQGNNKAITTPLSNAQLGEYFRNRLGLQNGAYVKRQDLENYGRTNVTFYKLDDEQYYMDFSI